MIVNNWSTCPFCGLHCTDLRLSFSGGRLVAFSPDCDLGKSGFQFAAFKLASEQLSKSSTDQALQKARVWMKEARQLLVVLSGDLDSDAVLSAIRLAKQYSAFLVCDEDITGSVFGLSMQTAGFLTGTLRDLRNLSLVVLCGVDPARSHPRLGEFLGRDLATRSLRFEPPDPLEALRWLRLARSGAGVNHPAAFGEIADQIETASSGLVVFGLEWLKAGRAFTTELLHWLTDLNRKNPWYALYLAPASNSTGVVEGLYSETGYPGNLRFCSEGVNYSPRLWRAERLIQQGGSDLCLLAGQPGSFSTKTLACLSQSRTILLDPHQPAWHPPVWLPSAQAGVDSPGQAQRLDGVPVDLHPVLPVQRPLMKDLLLELTHEDH
jgi:formylmethanofuran dehydrogenase subunit B